MFGNSIDFAEGNVVLLMEIPNVLGLNGGTISDLPSSSRCTTQ